MKSFSQFQQTPYFPVLDGLRALSVLLVVALHTGDPLWMSLHGTVGVTVFFVISGWLITTLLLREEQRRGRVALGSFYLRRIFRLLPVYFTVLILVGALTVLGNLGMGRHAFLDALPYYLTYQNDFAPGADYAHTWSLAIEEKFYVLWPLLAFTALFLRRIRLWTVCILTALTLAAEFREPTYYFATYTPLLFGCTLALLMHEERSYNVLRRLASTPVLVVLVILALLQTAFFEGTHGHVHTVFAVLTALALPGFLIGENRLCAAAGNRWMLYIGQRSYSIYLVHVLVIAAVDRIVPPASPLIAVQVVHFVAAALASVAAAAVLYRMVELPFIAAGRKLLASRTARRAPAPA